MKVLTISDPFLTEPTKPKWYLAYGSNLAASTFLGRRGIHPLAKANVVVEGLELRLNIPALPYMEPRMANCATVSESATSRSLYEKEKDNDYDPTTRWTGKQRLMGVAYLVSASDFATIIKTEGAGTAYRPLLVPCDGLDSEGYKTGEKIDAFTLQSTRTREDYGEASLRYLGLLRTGAEENSLPQPFQSYLTDDLHSYTMTSLSQSIGRVVFLAIWMPIYLPFLALASALADDYGNAPAWVATMLGNLSIAMWESYERVARPLFGEGEKTES